MARIFWPVQLSLRVFLYAQKQVEYLLSSMSLLSNDFIAKHVGKDPEGYGKDLNIITWFDIFTNISNPHSILLISAHWPFAVPIPIIASTKKIKSLVTNNQLLTQALRSSPNLVSFLLAKLLDFLPQNLLNLKKGFLLFDKWSYWWSWCPKRLSAATERELDVDYLSLKRKKKNCRFFCDIQNME